jgi:single-stranded DNA-binding protein
MSQIRATFSGGVVADPERREAGGAQLLEFPVYVNHQRKVKGSEPAEYEPTGDTSKIKVTLWRDLADTEIHKGDIVEITGTLVEKAFERRDGTEGRAIQTDFVESVVVKWRKPAEGSAPAGF